MAHPHFHAVSSAKKHGGTPEDYVELHSFFDQSKAHHADFRHRAILHSTFGIFLAEQVFGVTISVTLPNGKVKEVPTRILGEQHVMEDMGRIPTVSDWVSAITPEPWMNRSRKLSRELAEEAEAFAAQRGMVEVAA